MNQKINLDKIIDSLKEQAADKYNFVDEEDPDDIFLKDYKMLLAAAEALETLR